MISIRCKSSSQLISALQAASCQHFLENAQLPSVLAGERRKSPKEAQEEKREQIKGVHLAASPHIDILTCSEATSEDSSQ